VREGVMRKEKLADAKTGETKFVDVNKYVKDEDFVISIIECHLEERKIDIKSAPIIVSGGYGVGSRENFDLLFELAAILGGEVGASRAAVDAGYADHARQVGQTGVTVRPKLYVACGISGQVQHTAGMQESAMIIAINSDPNAPINQVADYSIVGDLSTVIPKMIKYYKANSK
jgi:electron transfer flavoprotein alpha subunit